MFMFDSRNPTLFDLLRAGCKVEFPGGATMDGRYDVTEIRPEGTILVTDAAGKGPWAYSMVEESLGMMLEPLGLYRSPARFIPNPDVEFRKAKLQAVAWDAGCHVALIDAIRFCQTHTDLSETMRTAHGPGVEQLREEYRLLYGD